MVAVERVTRYVEQMDAVHSRRQDDLDRAAVERHLKSKVVSKIVLWTLHNRRRLRETLLCAEPPMPSDEYGGDSSHQRDAAGPREEASCDDWRTPQELLREFVATNDDAAARMDESDDGDTDSDECRDDAEGLPPQQNVRHDEPSRQPFFAPEIRPVLRPAHGTETVAPQEGVPNTDKLVGTKRFTVECVGRDDSNIKSTIADQVFRTVQELRTDADPLNESPALPTETVEVEIKVFRQLNEQSPSVETHSKNHLSVVTDQLDVPEPPSLESWCLWWSMKGWFSCGE